MLQVFFFSLRELWLIQMNNCYRSLHLTTLVHCWVVGSLAMASPGVYSNMGATYVKSVILGLRTQSMSSRAPVVDTTSAASSTWSTLANKPLSIAATCTI
jgi:hypothetical protein